MNKLTPFKLRVITGLSLIPLVLCAIYLSSHTSFMYLLSGLMALAAWEWAQFAGLKQTASRAVYAMITAVLFLYSMLFAEYYPVEINWVLAASFLWWLCVTVWVLLYSHVYKFWISNKFLILLMGWMTLLPFAYALLELKLASDTQNEHLIVFAVALVCVGDVSAYFSGKHFGKRKLAVAISPGKTIVGFFGQVIASALFALSAPFWFKTALSPMVLFLFGAVCGLFAVVGDLFESMFKRQVGLKDSSAILPGHGGILDRLDSLVAAVPLFAGVYLLM